MHHRRLAALFVVLALVLAACGAGDRPELGEAVTGEIGGADGAGNGDGPDDGGAVDGTGGGSAGDGTGGTPPTTSVAPPAVGGGAAAQAPAGATAALDAYFDALAGEDWARARASSIAGPRLMARIRELVSRFNAQREGTTELHYSERSFSSAGVEPNLVRYSGRAVLEATVSGPAGAPRSDTDAFSEPTVSVAGNAWAVTNFLYQDRPIVAHEANGSATVGHVTFTLEGALAFSGNTGVVVGARTEGAHSLRVDDVQLTFGDGTVLDRDLGFLVEREPSFLYFTFDRRDERPTALTASVTVDGGTDQEETGELSLRF